MTNDAYQVLIVEDEPDINNLLAEILAAYGLETIQAFTGEDALRLVQKHRPDAIVLDLMLPGLSGYAVCSQLKTARSTSGIPVVILTALDRAADRRQAFETGADEYVTKPFSPEGFVERLQTCIERTREAADAAVVSMVFELSLTNTCLKAINAAVTSLYCQTGLPEQAIEKLRSGLLRLASAAKTWAEAHDDTPPANVHFELENDELRLVFEPACDEAETFLEKHLGDEALIPSEWTDAGAIDRHETDGATVVLTKSVPPEPAAAGTSDET